MERHRDESPLLDYRALAGWIATAALVLGALAFAGVVVSGLAAGLSFGLLGRWLALYLVALALVTGLLAAAHAWAGARRARRRGTPLADEGTGLLPPRRPQRD